MSANWSNPALGSQYSSFLSDLKERDVDAVTLNVGNPSNPPTGSIKLIRSPIKIQEWSGTAWDDKPISISGGGTGAATKAAGFDALSPMTGKGDLISHDGTNGIKLGPGTNGQVLTVDSTETSGLKWGTVSVEAIPPGSITGYGGSAAPSGWLLCGGAAVSRETYATLFGVIGTTYGVGDGSTTFNIPNLKQKFPLGKADSGTGNVLGQVGGAIDHTHTVASHTHTFSIASSGTHTHTTASAGGHEHGGVTGTTNLAHTHSFSDTSSGPSATTASTQQGADVWTPTTTHTHNVSGTTGSALTTHSHTINDVGGHTHTISGDGSHTHTGTTALGGTGTTNANNPPYLVINYIIKY